MSSQSGSNKVAMMVAGGFSLESIAKRLNCSVAELEAQYDSELRKTLAELRAKVGANLFAAARDGNITAIIFWLKTRAGWRERAGRESPELTPPPQSRRPQVRVLLPCNGRCTMASRTAKDPHLRREQYEKVLRRELPVLPDSEYPKRWTDELRREARKKAMAIIYSKHPELKPQENPDPRASRFPDDPNGF